jgi:nickel-dependent lactate racemase
MEIRLPWGKDALGVTVPDTWNVIYPARISPEKKRRDTGVAIVTKAMQNPFGMKPLDSMKLKGKRVVIIVDDNTRPTPAYTFFTLILDSLKKAGADLKNVVLLPGLGIHTAMTEEEMADKVGAKNLKKIKWENHNAFDPTAQHFFGSTMRGTPVYLNKRLASADLIILVGLIEPHLWAGFGGGMKNILPGVASAETIGRHHEIIAEPPYRFNRVGVLPEENSFRQDLEEIRR